MNWGAQKYTEKNETDLAQFPICEKHDRKCLFTEVVQSVK